MLESSCILQVHMCPIKLHSKYFNSYSNIAQNYTTVTLQIVDRPLKIIKLFANAIGSFFVTIIHQDIIKQKKEKLAQIKSKLLHKLTHTLTQTYIWVKFFAYFVYFLVNWFTGRFWSGRILDWFWF